MARTSRKNGQETSAAVKPVQPLFKTAVYARLSAEDRETLSLENQILMVQKYIEKIPELTFCGVFSDNGLTGTNFNRPGFENLMDEIRRGSINCIVVKDLSRFGRDYVEAGNFIEVIFPRLGVRFISMGDNYDSFDPRCQGEGMSIALKNMINAFYAKDISAKIRASYIVKRQNGEFTGKCPPFGYVKSPESVNKLIVDDEASDIVRLIFKLKLDGLNVYQIGRHLTQQNVPAPGHYRYIKGIHKEKRYEKPQAWDSSVIKDMLESVVYLGHLASGKTTINANGKQVAVPRDKWVIVENPHQAIISQADFDMVQEHFKEITERQNNKNRHDNHDELPENLLEGLAFCMDCGRAYRRVASLMRDRRRYRVTYICVKCNENSPKYTYRHFKQSNLYDALYASIRMEIDLCVNQKDDYMKICASNGARKRKSEIDGGIKRIQNRLDRFPVLKLDLYNDYRSKLLNESEYKLLNAQYDNEKATLTLELEKLTAEKERLQPDYINGNKWVTLLDRFIESRELSREVLLAVVERIEVSRDLRIEITYRFNDERKKLVELVQESWGCLNG